MLPRKHNAAADACMHARRLPQGNLSVVYDELGNKYDIPAYCLSEPNNLVKTDGDTPPTATWAGETEDAGRSGAPEASAVEVLAALLQ